MPNRKDKKQLREERHNDGRIWVASGARNGWSGIGVSITLTDDAVLAADALGYGPDMAAVDMAVTTLLPCHSGWEAM